MVGRPKKTLFREPKGSIYKAYALDGKKFQSPVYVVEYYMITDSRQLKHVSRRYASARINNYKNNQDFNPITKRKLFKDEKLAINFQCALLQERNEYWEWLDLGSKEKVIDAMLEKTDSPTLEAQIECESKSEHL
jgi:hypothetical protein